MQTIRGKRANKGVVIGEVVKIDRVDYSELAKKDFTKKILVVHSFTPDLIIFVGKIAGIISETGGATSHAAIIAIEFGIPCVVAAAKCTELLNDGDLVKLNGDEGTVNVL